MEIIIHVFGVLFTVPGADTRQLYLVCYRTQLTNKLPFDSQIARTLCIMWYVALFSLDIFLVDDLHCAVCNVLQQILQSLIFHPLTDVSILICSLPARKERFNVQTTPLGSITGISKSQFQQRVA